MKLYTHLNFGGNCEEAFRFYEEHLGGKITAIIKKTQLPASYEVEPGTENHVIHARMSLAGVELIANDVPEGQFQPIRSSYLFLILDTTKEAERIYSLLAEGAQVGMPLQETFFATRFAQLRDRFGTLWTIVQERDHQEQKR